MGKQRLRDSQKKMTQPADSVLRIKSYRLRNCWCSVSIVSPPQIGDLLLGAGDLTQLEQCSNFAALMGTTPC